MPRYYHIGNGKPPFEFIYAGTSFVVHPPDRVWKRVAQEYVVGVSPNGKERKDKRFVWELDEAATARGKKARNYIDLTDDQAKYFSQGKFEEVRQYVKRQSEIESVMDEEYDNFLEKRAEKIEEAKRKHFAELEELEREHQNQVAAIQNKRKG